MAVYMIMKKIEETEEKVVYYFGPNEEYMGILEYNKAKGKVYVLKEVNDETGKNTAYARWATQKIARILHKENGVFKDTVIIAH